MSIEIAVIVGSLRRDSFNAKLAHGLAKLAPADFKFTHVDIGSLPLYNQDDDANQAAPVKKLKEQVKAALASAGASHGGKGLVVTEGKKGYRLGVTARVIDGAA